MCLSQHLYVCAYYTFYLYTLLGPGGLVSLKINHFCIIQRNALKSILPRTVGGIFPPEKKVN